MLVANIAFPCVPVNRYCEVTGKRLADNKIKRLPMKIFM